ncbi:hypothetical protein BMS3Abin16_01794 [archaeon BMS3Abin16]|nr:hypothetical protein BMS3Abin16_01794 [archaeon BMS3Abin16]
MLGKGEVKYLKVFEVDNEALLIRIDTGNAQQLLLIIFSEELVNSLADLFKFKCLSG